MQPRADVPVPGWWLWQEAWAEALYGPGGFFRREVPSDHFRTSAHASPLLGRALAGLVAALDAELGHPDRLDVVDVGAGRGELLAAIAAALPTPVRERSRLVAVELADRPADLDPAVRWTDAVPDGVVGLVIAHELLDTVPCPIVEVADDGVVRMVEVDGRGAERLGAAADADQVAWLARWWPIAQPGERAEVGRPRDEAWIGLVTALDRGVALAVDYAHLRPERVAGAYPRGTLAAYRHGRLAPPVPDGGRDLTAHVALDACAEAGLAAGAAQTLLLTQREALRRLGIRAERPPSALAESDPRAYLAALRAATQAGELLDPAGLGGFGWLAQSVGCRLPAALR